MSYLTRTRKTTAIIILQPLYKSTCVSHDPRQEQNEFVEAMF